MQGLGGAYNKYFMKAASNRTFQLSVHASNILLCHKYLGIRVELSESKPVQGGIMKSLDVHANVLFFTNSTLVTLANGQYSPILVRL